MKAQRYSDDHIPCVTDVATYQKLWIDWWTACQPPSRWGKGWPLPKEQVEKAAWGKLSARGKNGLFLVVMSTTWWAASLKSADHRRVFAEAVDDIRWVVEQQLANSLISDTPAVGKNAHSTPKSDASTLPTWLRREGDGKRVARPSHQLKEAMK